MSGLDAGLRVAITTAIASLVITTVAVIAYGVASFLLMQRHVPTRGYGISLRELAREVWVVALIQPIFFLFYLVGRRMKPGSGVPIVFVHGYMQNRVGFIVLARLLARKGLGPMFGINYPWWDSIASNAARLERFVARVRKETGSAVVDLVCHSMGGIVAVEMMRDEARRDELGVRRCVTIGTPHAGVMWRGPVIGASAGHLRRGSKLLAVHAGVKLAVPFLSVFSTHDNIVHPKESASLALRGGRDVEVDGLPHLAMLFSSQVADHVAAFLAEPDGIVAPPCPKAP